ncbi:MAG: flavodoxin domain-containing protein [Candidatus Thorarchaeota archaeon]|jgi:menaquinone-dependent protoporphyrinogen oxidase
MRNQGSMNENNDNIKNVHKVLVAYDSESGSTGEVADFIGNILSENGNIVEVKTVRETVDLTSYDRIIIGSPIRYDKWMSDARKFVKNNQEILSKIPVAFFFTCLVLSKKSDKTARQAKEYSDKLYDIAPLVKPASVMEFEGFLDYSKLPFTSRMILRLYLVVLRVKERDRSIAREGDYRDWHAIRSWVESIDFG